MAGTTILGELEKAANNPSVLCSMSLYIRIEFQRLMEPKINCEKSNEDLSTPELIDQAFAKGEITDEERLLYVAYAMYEYESLPVQFRGNKGWRGTLVSWELYEVANDPSILCSMSLKVRSELQRLLNPHTTCDS